MYGTGNLAELPLRALIRSVKGRQAKFGRSGIVAFMIRFLRSADIFRPPFSHSFVSTARPEPYSMIWIW